MSKLKNAGPAAKAPAAKDPRDGGAASQGLNPLVPPGAPPSDHEKTPASTQPGGGRVRKTIEETVPVRVHTAFRLTDDSGRVFPYAQGVQEMPLSHAQHWYTKHHVVADDEA